MQAVGIGDLHLTSVTGVGGLSAYIKDPDQMVKREVFRVLKWAKRRGIKRCFFYGDLCEGTRMSYEATMALLEILRQDFEFELILGNHDLFSEDPSLGHSLQLIQEFNLPNVRVHDKPTVCDLDGVKVKFLPWPHQDFSSRFLNVAHVDVAGAKTDSGRPVNKGDKSTALAVIGHIHTRQQVRNCHYAGTLYQTNFGESKSKFFHHLTYDQGFTIQDIPFVPEYTLHTVHVRKRKDLEHVPRSTRDLVKLVLHDCSISAADIAGINVVMTKTASKEQAQSLLNEEAKSGSAVELSISDFFHTWLEGQPIDEEDKAEVAKLRTTLLKT